MQLKSGGSYLRTRKGDENPVFDVKNPRHLEFWVNQPVDVYLVIRDAEATIRWMNVTKYLKATGAIARRGVEVDVYWHAGNSLARESGRPDSPDRPPAGASRPFGVSHVGKNARGSPQAGWRIASVDGVVSPECAENPSCFVATGRYEVWRCKHELHDGNGGRWRLSSGWPSWRFRGARRTPVSIATR